MLRAPRFVAPLSFALALAVSSCGGDSGSSGGHDGGIDAPVSGSLGGAAGGAGGGATAGGSGDGGPVAGSSAAHDGGADASADGGSVDGGTDPRIARGKYLVGIIGCAGCHTPTVAVDGGAAMPDNDRAFSGKECFVPANSAKNTGCLHSANITPDNDTGIGKLTDKQIIDLFRTGKRPQVGDYLFSAMPYHQLSVLSDDDSSAIVAYLRTLKPVAHRVPANEAPYDVRPTAPEKAGLPVADLPDGTDADGKYLGALLCVNCHTIDKPGSTPLVIDKAKAYEGGRMFAAYMTMAVTSMNLTPDDTGIKTWSTAELVKTIRMGIDKNGGKVCPPMRGNAALKDEDATHIATYLLSIGAKNNPVGMQCTAP